jgi:hypothetical protein
MTGTKQSPEQRSMRKLLLFVIASAMLFGGLYLLGAEMLFGQRLSGKFIACAVMLILLGGYLIWVDFAAPLLRIKTWEDQ